MEKDIFTIVAIVADALFGYTMAHFFGLIGAVIAFPLIVPINFFIYWLCGGYVTKHMWFG